MAEALAELPQLDGEVRHRMTAALQAAIDHDGYTAFLEAPAPDFSLPLGVHCCCRAECMCRGMFCIIFDYSCCQPGSAVYLWISDIVAS